MLVALTVAIMFVAGIFPYLTYALPAIAGFLITIAVIELGSKWAWMVYGAVSLLCLFLIPAKQTAMIYVFFFGYYPIAKKWLESKLPHLGEWFLKFLIFNISMVSAFAISIYIFGIPLDETGDFRKYAAYVLLGLGNAVFVLYDIALTKLIQVYLLLWQPRIHKLFKY